MFFHLHKDILQYFWLGGEPEPAKPFVDLSKRLSQGLTTDIKTAIVTAIRESLGLVRAVGHAAHIGGSVGGALATYLLGPRISLTFYEILPAAGGAAAGGAASAQRRVIDNRAKLQEIINGGGTNRIRIEFKDRPPIPIWN